MNKNELSYSVVVPTLNAAKEWPEFSRALLACVDPERVLVIDSSSSDGTAELAEAAGFQVVQIKRSEFNHGGTRQFGADLVPQSDLIVYLTQDAVLKDAGAIERLISVFRNERVAAAFGRQLPRRGAGPLEAHARLFNYGPESTLRNAENRAEFGCKTVFFSNSFGAYRRVALQSVGGFPRDVIFGEDTVTIGRMVLRGWEIAYVADAEAFHSHEYSAFQDFRRYFDIGVLHSREAWLFEEFHGASGEGSRFVKSELAYLWPLHWRHIPSALLRTGLKLLGYHAGHMEGKLSGSLKRRLSMNRFFWTELDEA